MYTPHVGRWLSEDSAGYVDGPNQYLYVTNTPTNWTDPSGMCKICGEGGIRYRVAIVDLDRFTKHAAYRKLADFAAAAYQTPGWRAFGFTVPMLTAAGPFSQLNEAVPNVPAGIQKLAFFMFFVDWDICETPARDGDDGKCHLFLDETGSSVTWTTHGGNPKVIKIGKNEGELVAGRGDWTVDDRNPPLGACDKTLIYVDAPGWKANRRVVQIPGPDQNNRWGGFVTIVKQTFQVKDGAGNVLSNLTHQVKVAVDEDLNATFSP
jgi:hypothetical protein